MGLSEAFIAVAVNGLASGSFAHEVAAEESYSALGTLLPIAAYSVPGIVVVLVLNEYARKLPALVRYAFSTLFPLWFWIVIFSAFATIDRSVFELLLDPELYYFLVDGWPITGPACALIVLAGFLDQRRRSAATRAQTYSNL